MSETKARATIGFSPEVQACVDTLTTVAAEQTSTDSEAYAIRLAAAMRVVTSSLVDSGGMSMFNHYMEQHELPFRVVFEGTQWPTDWARHVLPREAC